MSMIDGNFGSGLNPSQMLQGGGNKFKTADADGNKAVSKQEFINAMEDMGLDTNQIDKMFGKMDIDANGEVSYQEHQDMISTMEQRMGSMMGSGGSGASQEGFDAVKTLLESLQSNSDDDNEKQMLQQAIDKMSAEGNSKATMTESLTLINELIPGIDTSA